MRDTFTRADNASVLGVGETGHAWTVGAGTFGIASNQGYSASDANNDVATIDPGIGNAELEIALTGDVDNVGSNRRYYDIAIRFTDTANYLRVHLLAGFVVLQTVVGGSVTQVAAAAQTSTDGVAYRFKIRYVGPTIWVWVDGVLRITYTLTGADVATFASSISRVGLVLAKANTPTEAARFDNLVVRAA